MNSGQQLSYDGYEVLLYPLEFVNITAGPDAANHIVTGVSNTGLWDNGWYINQYCPLYAPCSMHCIASYPTGSSNGHGQLWISNDKVWIPQSSEPVYVSMAFLHSNILLYDVGDYITQGTQFYQTGDFGLGSGPHVHMILQIGARSNMFPTGPNPYYGNIWYSPAPPSTIATFFYLTGEPARGSGGYGGLNWTVWDGPTPPEPPVPGDDEAALIYFLINSRKKGGTIVL